MITAIKKRIAIEASSREIVDYLYVLLDEIKIKGETPELASAKHFFYARFLFSQNELDKAYNEFSRSSTLCIDNGLMEFYEIAFWLGKIAEKQDNLARAKMCFEGALKLCENNPLFVSSDEILDALIVLEKKQSQQGISSINFKDYQQAKAQKAIEEPRQQPIVSLNEAVSKEVSDESKRTPQTKTEEQNNFKSPLKQTDSMEISKKRIDASKVISVVLSVLALLLSAIGLAKFNSNFLSISAISIGSVIGLYSIYWGFRRNKKVARLLAVGSIILTVGVIVLIVRTTENSSKSTFTELFLGTSASVASVIASTFLVWFFSYCLQLLGRKFSSDKRFRLKTVYTMILLLPVLLFTNPSLNDFKESGHYGENHERPHKVHRESNYLIFSKFCCEDSCNHDIRCYDEQGQRLYYWGILKNFYRIED